MSNGSRDMGETIKSVSRLEPSLATRHELKKNINDVLLEMEYHISELTKQEKESSRIEFISNSQMHQVDLDKLNKRNLLDKYLHTLEQAK